jgi:hypothetical protein
VDVGKMDFLGPINFIHEAPRASSQTAHPKL